MIRGHLIAAIAAATLAAHANAADLTFVSWGGLGNRHRKKPH